VNAVDDRHFQHHTYTFPSDHPLCTTLLKQRNRKVAVYKRSLYPGWTNTVGAAAIRIVYVRSYQPPTAEMIAEIQQQRQLAAQEEQGQQRMQDAAERLEHERRRAIQQLYHHRRAQFQPIGRRGHRPPRATKTSAYLFHPFHELYFACMCKNTHAYAIAVIAVDDHAATSTLYCC